MSSIEFSASSGTGSVAHVLRSSYNCYTLPLLINPACVPFLERRGSVSGLTEEGRSEHVAWYRCALGVPVVLETHSHSWDENWPLEEPSHSEPSNDVKEAKIEVFFKSICVVYLQWNSDTWWTFGDPAFDS